MVQINWLHEARLDLKGNYEYIALDSKRYAKIQILSIRNRIQILKTHPQTGKIVDELQLSQIRELIEGNYRIIYRIVSEKSIDILLERHSAKDLMKRIRD